MSHQRLMVLGKRKAVYSHPNHDLYLNKAAAVDATNVVVGIASHNLPVELCESFPGYIRMAGPPPKSASFYGNGIILECSEIVDASDGDAYLSTIVAPATLFKGIIDIDVYVYDSTGGVCYKAKLLKTDFYYNLALITINSPSELPSAVLTPINDALSINPTKQLKKNKTKKKKKNKPRLFKVVPDMLLASVSLSDMKPLSVIQGSGTLSLRTPSLKKNDRIRNPKGFPCNQLYEIKKTLYLGHDGSAVLNSFGKIIGIYFYYNLFLPSNVVLSWWNHYKSSGGFSHPFLGMEVTNLHEADFNFLTQFIVKFPDISSAVVVTKVEEDSPASRSGICTKDVIVKVEGKQVHSKLELYETIWGKVGNAVEVNVLRVTDGKEVEVSLLIEEATPNQFYEWPHPGFDCVY